MREFTIQAPDGRRLRRQAESAGALMAVLLEGWTLVDEVVDTLVVPVLPDILPRHTLMTHLLREYGDELREWLVTELRAAHVTVAEAKSEKKRETSPSSPAPAGPAAAARPVAHP